MLRAELRSAVARLGGLHAGVPGAVRSWGNGKKGWEIAWEMIGEISWDMLGWESQKCWEGYGKIGLYCKTYWEHHGTCWEWELGKVWESHGTCKEYTEGKMGWSDSYAIGRWDLKEI